MARPALCKSPGCTQVATRNDLCPLCRVREERRAINTTACTRCSRPAGQRCTLKKGTHQVRIQRYQRDERQAKAALMAVPAADLLAGVDLGALFDIDLVPEPIGREGET